MNKDSKVNLQLLFFSFLLFFTSCNNFSVPSTTKISGERSVSENFTFTVDDKNYGIIELEDEILYKVDSTNFVSFTEYPEYQFIKWEVINASTGKVVSDVISFEDQKNPETRITVLKVVNNIILRPVCCLRPQVSASYPVFADSGVYCDSVILVTFDKTISETSIYYSDKEISVLDYDFLLANENGTYGYVKNGNIHYKNIQITSADDENLLSYFTAPQIVNGTLLKITPVADQKLLTSAGSFLDIDVFISPEFADSEGISIGGTGLQYRYRINSNTDDVAPVFESIQLAKTEEKLTSSFSADFLSQEQSFSATNHVNGTLFYNINGSDNSGSLNYVKLEAKRIQSPFGQPVEEDAVVQILPVASGSNFELTNEDGLIELNFTLYDMSGNESETSYKYFVAKDTTVDVSGICIFNEPDFVGLNVLTEKSLNSAVQKISWCDVSDDVWQKDNKTLASDLKYTFFWDTEALKYSNKISCSKEINYSDGKWTVEIPSFSYKKELYIKILVEDALGNQNFAQAVIPCVPEFFTYEKIADGGEYIYTDEVSGKQKTIPYPAYYRIFFSNSNHNLSDAGITSDSNDDFSHLGFLYYTYDDSDELHSQAFLNLTSDETLKTAELECLKYADLYVDDISKCHFYFQTACCKKTSENKAELYKNNLESLYQNLEAEKSSGNLLRKLEEYSPDLRNIYFYLIKTDREPFAQKLLTNFYLWNGLFENGQHKYCDSLLFSTLTKFDVTEAKNLTAPSVQSIIVQKGAVNSGVNIATVQFGSTAPYGVVYNILWGKEENQIVNYETSETFEIESGIEKLYYKTVVLDSKTNETKTSDVNVYDLSQAAFDTVPPVVENLKKETESHFYGAYTASEYYPVITCEICYDTYKVENGKAQYTLYVVPERIKGMTFDQLSEEEITSSPCLVQNFVPPASAAYKAFVWNKIEGLGVSGRCFYVVYVEDAAGNYSFNPIKVSKLLLNEAADVKIAPKDEERVELSFEIKKEDGCYNYEFDYFLLSCDELEDNGGKLKEEKNVIQASFAESWQKAVVPAKKDSFYYVYAKAAEKAGVEKYSVPLYFYAGNEDDVSCGLKNLLEGTNGAQIYCDRPCLVMTYWSSQNYGTDAGKWEAYGVHGNPMYISCKNDDDGQYEETVKYYTVDSKNIPKGQFFVVIAHFADGTVLMTKNVGIN